RPRPSSLASTIRIRPTLRVPLLHSRPAAAPGVAGAPVAEWKARAPRSRSGPARNDSCVSLAFVLQASCLQPNRSALRNAARGTNSPFPAQRAISERKPRGGTSYRADSPESKLGDSLERTRNDTNLWYYV